MKIEKNNNGTYSIVGAPLKLLPFAKDALEKVTTHIEGIEKMIAIDDDKELPMLLAFLKQKQEAYQSVVSQLACIVEEKTGVEMTNYESE